eukprot:TRINITY_DN12986_c0_g1_i1.p2 TRINITY_DN12986_c0_g1~~TRINITY_DN12986_c0_g1_i1.p2  ORF type:complete len:200 (+),score=90.52 TRINITY_DN12986_c0_g1_i1:65-664(+)
MAERVSLYDTQEERERISRLADLYSVVVAIEKVETAHNRSTISAADYETQCASLLAKYKNIYAVVAQDIGSLEKFLQEYGSSYPTAVVRIKAGVPLTREDHSGVSGTLIMEATQHMISCADVIGMKQYTAEILQPILADIVSTTSKLAPNLPELRPIQEWLRKVNGMRAVEELSEEEARECQHDVNKVFNAFKTKLGSQ